MLASKSAVVARPVAKAAAARRSSRATPARAAAEPLEAPPPPPAKDNIGDLFNFSGWGPEVFNGRLAMVGFVAGVGAELATGESTVSQFSAHTGSFVFAAALFTLVSIIPRLQGENTAKPESKEGGMWTASTEMLNGRAAMIGMAALIGQEIATGQAIF